MSTEAVLQTVDLRMAFGGLKIFRTGQSSASVARERHAVIGPNGAVARQFRELERRWAAGKPTGGALLLEGAADVTGKTPVSVYWPDWL